MRFDAQWLTIGERRWPVAGYEAEDVHLRDDHVMHVRRACVRFECGVTLSILWGGATYSSNYDSLTTGVWHEEPDEVEVAMWLHGHDGLVGPAGWVNGNALAHMLDTLAGNDVETVKTVLMMTSER